MAAYLFHGIRIACTARIDPDPVAALLGRFREPDPAGPAELAIELAEGVPGPRAPEGAVVFRHGPLEVRWDGRAALAVASPAALLRVRPDGTGIAGTCRRPSTDAELDALAHVELLVALALALHRRNVFHLHAAALVAPSGPSLLVAGTGGSGKSTLAAALVASGHAYLGDDVAFVAERDGAPTLLALPRAFHLSGESARALPATLPHLDEPRRSATGKHRVDARAAFPGAERLAAPAPGLLLFPEIAGAGATRVEPLSRAEALGGLLSASLFATSTLGSASQRALLAAIADSASGYRVLLGRDLLSDAVGTALRIRAAVTATP